MLFDLHYMNLVVMVIQSFSKISPEIIFKSFIVPNYAKPLPKCLRLEMTKTFFMPVSSIFVNQIHIEISFLPLYVVLYTTKNQAPCSLKPLSPKLVNLAESYIQRSTIHLPHNRVHICIEKLCGISP